MLFDGQVLKRQRGSSFDVTVKKMAGAEELLKAALFKHKAHLKNLINPAEKQLCITLFRWNKG